MSESPSTGTRAAERNKGGRSAAAEESRRQRAEFKKVGLWSRRPPSASTRVHERTNGEAGRLREAPAVGSARASRERDGNMGRRRRDGVIRPPRRPKSDTGRGGDERTKEGRRVDEIRILTPGNGESNPATQHAGGGGADRKEGEGGYEAPMTILIGMRRIWAGKE
ncbi:hypothetical protein B0H14DRAFT_2599586 [Mycena olivaceomarginata]|nr:hypothetical protein B0H14DRAFT_2599586 [Mycena olivaceomarginata]